jgi:hypothetical protein
MVMLQEKHSPSLEETSGPHRAAVGNDRAALSNRPAGASPLLRTYLFRRNTGKEVSVWLIFILVGMLCASYVIWRNEAKMNESCLTGEIEKTIVGPKMGTRDSEIFVEMWVANRCSTPSSADIYRLSIDSDVLTVKTEQALIPGELTLFDPTTGAPILHFYASEALYKRTEEPIKAGARVDGWLAFRAQSVTPDQILAKGVKYTISFFDTANNVHTTKSYVQPGAKKYWYLYIPGHVSGFR